MASIMVVRSAVKVITFVIAEQLIEKKIEDMLSASARLLQQIVTENPESCKNFMRLFPSKFEELLTLT